METVAIAIAGLCFGVIITRARIPRFDPFPLICALVLVTIGVVSTTPWDGGTLSNGLIFVFAAVGAASLYGAQLWRKTPLNGAFSFWQLAWMSAFRPGYIRAAHDQAVKDDSKVTVSQ